MTFKDKTFCASIYCKNECGRKMTKKEYTELDNIMKANPTEPMLVSWGIFCGKAKEEDFAGND